MRARWRQLVLTVTTEALRRRRNSSSPRSLGGFSVAPICRKSASTQKASCHRRRPCERSPHDGQVHVPDLKRRQFACPETEERGRSHIVAVAPARDVASGGQPVAFLNRQRRREVLVRPGAYVNGRDQTITAQLVRIQTETPGRSATSLARNNGVSTSTSSTINFPSGRTMGDGESWGARPPRLNPQDTKCP